MGAEEGSAHFRNKLLLGVGLAGFAFGVDPLVFEEGFAGEAGLVAGGMSQLVEQGIDCPARLLLLPKFLTGNRKGEEA
jgi:hypothetical protein